MGSVIFVVSSVLDVRTNTALYVSGSCVGDGFVPQDPSALLEKDVFGNYAYDEFTRVKQWCAAYKHQLSASMSFIYYLIFTIFCILFVNKGTAIIGVLSRIANHEDDLKTEEVKKE